MMRAAAVLFVAALGCTHRHDATSASAPAIDSIRPDSIWAPRGSVTEVVIVGRGFIPGTPGRNTVHFDRMLLTSVPANADGTEIRLTIPDAINAGGEAPPTPVETGPYTLRVATPAGTSNAMTLRVYR